VVVNGNEMEIASATIADLLIEMGYEDMPVATALNMAVVRKKDRAQTGLKDRDRIEILVPMQGG
jgi:sulfur carrier protein